MTQATARYRELFAQFLILSCELDDAWDDLTPEEQEEVEALIARREKVEDDTSP